MRKLVLYLAWGILTCAVVGERNCGISQNAPPGESYTRICLPEWAVNRTYSASTSAPIASALSRDPSAVRALRQLISFVEDQSSRVDVRSNRAPLFEFPSQRPCNIYYSEASFSVNVVTSQYGFGVLKEYCTTINRRYGCSTCITDLNEPNRQSMRKTAYALENYFGSLGDAANDTILPSMGRDFSWKGGFTFHSFPYTTLLDKCAISQFTAFKVDGEWGINTPITNADKADHLPDWQRHYLVEVLRVENDKIVPIPMNLRKEPPLNFKKQNGFNTSFVANSTTVMNTWGGRPGVFMFAVEGGTADNPALRAALSVSAATIEQIEDATTTSGMAIFIVPILMTLVPLASFTEVDNRKLLVYTMMTDILTVLPLGIKGVEIIRFSATTLDAMSSRMYGTGLSADELVVMETWYAKCNAQPRAGIFGVLYLVLALVFMVIGVSMEFYAKRVFDRRAKLRKKLQGQERIFFNASWRKVGCNLCECSCVGLCDSVQSEGKSENYLLEAF